MELTKEEQALVIGLLGQLFEEGFGGEAEGLLYEKLIQGATNEMD